MSFLNKVTVEDLDVKGRRVLVRVDFNVPLKDGKVTNDNRIVGAIPTIRYLADHGAKVILCSHLGKPKGPDAAFTMAPVAARLGELMGRPVLFADDDTVVGENARRMVSEMKDGDILVLQNTRFRPEETKNLPEFSKELASLADVYVDDAFGSAHRAHCSTVGVTDYIKETAVGYLMEKEINYLGNAVEQPVRPLVAILGGAKVADKLKVINNLLDKVDTLIIGGGMAYTFLAAKGYEVGTSLLDAEKIGYCKEMMAKAEKNGVKLVLPVDTVTTAEFPNPIDAPIETLVVDSDKIPADRMGMDIGPKTRELYAEAVKDAKTVVWNGPMGVFENPVLAAGTIAVAKAEAKGVKLLLPVDVVVADSFPDPIDGPIDVTTVDAAAIPADKEGLDIGEKTCALFASAVKDAKTVVWNGPMGVFENPTLAKGTIAMAQALADSSATTIVGGGDSAAACEQLGFADKITHISTGGGASLEFLEGLELPGIACLEDK